MADHPEKVRNYWGYNFKFKSKDLQKRFHELYSDLCLAIYDDEFANGVKAICWTHVLAVKGVIPYIKKNLGDMIITYRKRYYVGFDSIEDAMNEKVVNDDSITNFLANWGHDYVWYRFGS